MVAIALIPKQLWIALFWGGVVGVIAWAAWQLYKANRQNQHPTNPPQREAKTLAQLMGDQPKAAPPLPRPDRSTIVPPPPPAPQATDDWAVEREAVAKLNQARAQALREKHSPSLATDAISPAPVTPAPALPPLPTPEPAAPSAEQPSTLPSQAERRLAAQPAQWRLDRLATARANQARAEALREKQAQRDRQAEPELVSVRMDPPAELKRVAHQWGDAPAGSALPPRPSAKHAQDQRPMAPPVGPAPVIEVASSYRTRPDRAFQEGGPKPAEIQAPPASSPSILARVSKSVLESVLGSPAPPLPPLGHVANPPSIRVADEPVAISRPVRQEPEVAIPRPAAAKWLSFDDSAHIQKCKIGRGWFYFGVAKRHTHERAFTVDPTLNVSAWTSDWRGEDVQPWNGYPDLSSANRLAFVGFLNSNRRDARFGLGFVLLYLRGIEHRLLEELPRIEDRADEAVLLLNEVDELRQAYGQDHYFRRQCQELIEFAQVKLDLCELEFEPDLRGWSLPNQVLTARALLHQQGLTENLAFAWAQTQVDELRSSTWNCVRNEVALRFKQLYNATFPQGMVIKAGKSKLTLGYTPIGSYTDSIQFKTDLPDVTRSVAPIRPLVELVKQAAADLEGLRKARRSKNRSPVGELAALPESLRGTWVPTELQDLARMLAKRVAAETAPLIAARTLAQAFALDDSPKLGKRDMTAMILALENMGFAIEPDLRFHGPIPSLDDQVVIFALPPQAARAPSPSYEASLLMIQAAVTLASGDAPIAPSELSAATRAIEKQFALPQSERTRLEAHLRLLQQAPVPLSRLEGKTRQLAEHDREAFAHALLDIAASDGQISPEEVRVIERFYKALGLDASRVPADLHHASVGVRRPSALSPKSMGLDVQVIEAKLAETARVQKVLSQIFTEAEEPTAPEKTISEVVSVLPDQALVPSTQAVEALPLGLDADHITLLAQVLAQGSEDWPQAEFESLCQGLELFPAGAMEMLNEASFSLCGEALIEGDDPLYVNDYAKAELAAALNQ